MTWHVTIGSAFYHGREPLEGNVRNYRDGFGHYWLGHDTDEVLYFDCLDCLDGWLRNMGTPDHYEGNRNIGIDLFAPHGEHHVWTDHVHYTAGGIFMADTWEWDQCEEPEGDDHVYCANCEEMLHEGEA